MRQRPCMPRLRQRRTASATVFAANAFAANAAVTAAAATDAGADTDTSTETNAGADPHAKAEADPHAKAEAESKTCVKLSAWLRIPGPGGPGTSALFAGGDASDERQSVAYLCQRADETTRTRMFRWIRPVSEQHLPSCP